MVQKIDAQVLYTANEGENVIKAIFAQRGRWFTAAYFSVACSRSAKIKNNVAVVYGVDTVVYPLVLVRRPCSNIAPQKRFLVNTYDYYSRGYNIEGVHQINLGATITCYIDNTTPLATTQLKLPITDPLIVASAITASLPLYSIPLMSPNFSMIV